jgi:glycosyltransferase involved in cell wall biosynthesis
MRICHVTPHLPPDQAANALLPAELAAWATHNGHQVTMVSHEPAQGRAMTPIDSGRVWRVPRKKAAGPVGKLLRTESIRQAHRIRRALKEAASDADVLHLHSNGLIVEVAAAWAAGRTPYILTLYGTEIWHFKRRRPVDLFARAFERAAAVTYYSRKLMEHSVHAGLRHPRGQVVYPAIGSSFVPREDGARESLRAALGITERRVILNVKRLHELAGQQYLIEAFARMARGRSDVRLVICGTGPLRDSLQALAKDRGIDGRVTFTGLVGNTVVAQYAAVADVFALPSLLEALPTVAVEALASGTPVVSADHPGGVELHELFGEDVQLVPKTSVDRLAEALLEAIDRPRRVSALTLDLTRRHFSLGAVTEAYAALYGSSLARDRQ